MPKKQFGVRLEDDLAKRVESYAADEVRDAANVIELCVIEAMPILEARRKAMLLNEPPAPYGKKTQTVRARPARPRGKRADRN